MPSSVRRIAGPVLLAVLLATAGCSLPLQPAPETEADTLTPVPDTPTPEANALPGVAGGQVVKPVELVDAHRDHLSGRSYTVTERLVVRNGTGVTHRGTVRVQWAGGGSERYHSVSRMNPFPDCDGTASVATFRRYSTGDWVYSNDTVCGRERVRQFGNENPGTFDPRQYLPFQPTRHEFLLSLLLPATADERTVEAASGGTYLISAPVPGYATEAYPFRSAKQRGEDVRTENASVVLTVTADGFVSSYRLRHTVVIDGRTYTVVRRGRFQAVGTTTLERPAWARPKSTPTSAGG